MLIAKLLKIVGMLGGAAAAFSGMLYIAAMGEYPVPKTIGQDPTLPRIEAGGKVFHGEAFGDPSAEPVIVIHGGPGWDYKTLLPLKALSDRYYVVFYDQMGTGLSPRVDDDKVSMHTLLADLDAMVDKFGRGGKVSLVGHSWGAMMASAYLGAHPEKVRRIVLAEPGFFNNTQAKEAGIRFGPAWTWDFMSHATWTMFEALHIDKPDKDAAQDYFIGQIATQANLEYYCAGAPFDKLSDHFRAGARSAQAIMTKGMDDDGNFTFDLTDGVDRFKDEVLFLAGDCNKMFGAPVQKKRLAAFPNARMVVIKGSGHMMFLEKPEESIAAVREYLGS